MTTMTSDRTAAVCDAEAHFLSVDNWPSQLRDFDPAFRWSWEVNDITSPELADRDEAGKIVGCAVVMTNLRGKTIDRETALALALAAHRSVCEAGPGTPTRSVGQ